MVKRVIVTGGAGFLGVETVKALRGYDIHLVSRSGSAPAGCTGHKHDLVRTDPADLFAAIAPTHLIHLAWHVPAGAFWTAAENLDWVAASLRVTRAFASAGGRRAVFAGTCAEYDWRSELLDEATTPLNPHTLYGEAKASLFRIVTAAAPRLGLSCAWGRIFFPYGPFEKPGRLFSSVVDNIAEGLPAPCSEGLQLRDFMHVDDLGRAFAALLDSDVEGAVNMASGECHSVREFVEEAARSMGGKSLLQIGNRPMQAGEPMVMKAATGRLRDEVQFVPSFGFKDGIADAVSRRLGTRAAA